MADAVERVRRREAADEHDEQQREADRPHDVEPRAEPVTAEEVADRVDGAGHRVLEPAPQRRLVLQSRSASRSRRTPRPPTRGTTPRPPPGATTLTTRATRDPSTSPRQPRTASTAAGTTSSTPTGRHSPARKPADRGPPEPVGPQAEEDDDAEHHRGRLGVAHHQDEGGGEQCPEPRGAACGRGIAGLAQRQPVQQRTERERRHVGHDDQGRGRVIEEEPPQTRGPAWARAGRTAARPPPPRGTRARRCRGKRRRPTRTGPGPARPDAAAHRSRRTGGATARARRRPARAPAPRARSRRAGRARTRRAGSRASVITSARRPAPGARGANATSIHPGLPLGNPRVGTLRGSSSCAVDAALERDHAADLAGRRRRVGPNLVDVSCPRPRGPPLPRTGAGRRGPRRATRRRTVAPLVESVATRPALAPGRRPASDATTTRADRRVGHAEVRLVASPCRGRAGAAW